MRLETNGLTFFCKAFVRGAVPQYSGMWRYKEWTSRDAKLVGRGHAFALYLSSDLSVIQALTSMSLATN
jgi:hypothetical protein